LTPTYISEGAEKVRENFEKSLEPLNTKVLEPKRDYLFE
jgi:hypothetical protein